MCELCGRIDSKTEFHHIIGRAQINKLSRVDMEYLIPALVKSSGIPLMDVRRFSVEKLRYSLIHKWPNNIIEVCGGCHDLTESSDKFINYKNSVRKKKRSSKPRSKMPDKVREILRGKGVTWCPKHKKYDKCNSRFNNSKRIQEDLTSWSNN